MTQRKACRYKYEIYIHRLFQGKSLNMANNESEKFCSKHLYYCLLRISLQKLFLFDQEKTCTLSLKQIQNPIKYSTINTELYKKKWKHTSVFEIMHSRLVVK